MTRKGFTEEQIGFALAAGLGLSMVVAAATYNEDRRDLLRDSPNSYLLTMKSDLG